MQNFYQHSIFPADYHFLFMQKLGNGNVGDGNFRPSFFIKKQYLSNG